jgi:hypothetical protein
MLDSLESCMMKSDWFTITTASLMLIECNILHSSSCVIHSKWTLLLVWLMRQNIRWNIWYSILMIRYFKQDNLIWVIFNNISICCQDISDPLLFWYLSEQIKKRQKYNLNVIGTMQSSTTRKCDPIKTKQKTFVHWIVWKIIRAQIMRLH